MANQFNLASATSPVIREIMRRRTEEVHNGTKLGLVIEGGGMRGVISAGVLAFMEEYGLGGVFDEVYAESAGAVNGAYFVAGQARYGSRIYCDNLRFKEFLNFWRLRKVMDLDYATDKVVGETRKLDCGRLRSSRTRLFVSLTHAISAQKAIVDIQQVSVPVLSVLKASSAAVPLYNHPVIVGGEPYVDGGISDPIPVMNAVRSGCTHILVLFTRPISFQPGALSAWEEACVRLFGRWWSPALREAFRSRWRHVLEARNVALGFTPTERDVAIAVIAPPDESPKVTRVSRDPRLLDAALNASFDQARGVFL